MVLKYDLPQEQDTAARMKVQPNIALQTWQLLFGIADDMREDALTRHSRKEAATFRELTISQQHMIKAVIRMTIDMPEGVTLKALADRLQLSSGAASAMVEVLVRKQILERTPCPLDRRAVRIRTTDKCRRLVAEGCRYFTEKTTAFLEELPETEQSFFLEMLKGLYHSISTHQLEKEVR